MTKKIAAILVCTIVALSASCGEAKPKWIPLFNGKDLNGWTVRGKAKWSVQEGVLAGVGGMGHIYSDATC